MGYTSDYATQEPGRADVDASAGPLLLEFGAPWCGHCLAAQDGIAQALAAHPGIGHLKIEDGRGRPLGRSFRIKLWPTLVFLRDGEERARLVRPRHAHEVALALATITGDPPG
jgi:thioredoxin 1